MTAIPHILLVKDDENDVFFLRLAFAGAELHVARDGREALEYLRVEEQDPLPALVLLDLKIPYVPGLEVLRSIRAERRLSSVIVVVLTSSASDRTWSKRMSSARTPIW